MLEAKRIQDYEGRCWKKVLGPDPRIRNPMAFPNIGRNLPATQGIGRLVAPRRSPRRSLQGYQKAPRIFTEASQKASGKVPTSLEGLGSKRFPARIWYFKTSFKGTV